MVFNKQMKAPMMQMPSTQAHK